MIECERIEPLIGRALDGELGAAESDRVRGHVESCDTCRTAQRRLEKIDRAFHQMLATEAAQLELASFWRGVERRIDQRKPWYRTWLDRCAMAPRSAWAVPALIALLLVLWSFDSYFPGWRGGVTRQSFAAVDSIDAHGRSVALWRENETRTTVIWLYDEPEGEHETAEEAAERGPAF
jgi:anti-sigma factor RsiW